MGYKPVFFGVRRHGRHPRPCAGFDVSAGGRRLMLLTPFSADAPDELTK